MQNNLYYRSKTISYLFVLYFLIIVPLVKIFSQPGIRENYQYLSPLPNAVLVQPETDIIIRQGNDINPSTLSDKFIEINGS
ncbi:MAG: hypothetical protein OQK63_10620, partial [Ignavibacteriaceae bacterium]|nr:hypothetical protein [Ignavibacteriaceae bacterium]